MNSMGKRLITFWVGGVLGTLAGGRWIRKQYEKHCEQTEKNADQFSDYYTLMRQWVQVYQEGHTLADYFRKEGYRKVALYGMNDMCYMLLKELEGTDTEVLYCIDRNADNLFAKIDVRKPGGDLPPVDAVVVAVIQYYGEVKADLSRKMTCPILSLADIVWEI